MGQAKYAKWSLNVHKQKDYIHKCGEREIKTKKNHEMGFPIYFMFLLCVVFWLLLAFVIF